MMIAAITPNTFAERRSSSEITLKSSERAHLAQHVCL